MYWMNYDEDKTNYKYCLQESIDKLTLLMDREGKNSVYYEKLLKDSQSEDEKQLLLSIREDEMEHIEVLKRVYLDFTGRNYNCSHESIGTSTDYRNSILWALLDKFQVIKIYNSILECLADAKHKAQIIKIINDELTHIGELNFMLISNRQVVE